MHIRFWFNAYSVIKLLFGFYICGEVFWVERLLFCMKFYLPNIISIQAMMNMDWFLWFIMFSLGIKVKRKIACEILISLNEKNKVFHKSGPNSPLYSNNILPLTFHLFFVISFLNLGGKNVKMRKKSIFCSTRSLCFNKDKAAS